MFNRGPSDAGGRARQTVVATAGGPSQKMGAAAALLWRRRLAMSGGVAAQELLGLPRLALMDGTSGRLGRTKGGRWGEATRSANPPFASNLKGH